MFVKSISSFIFLFSIVAIAQKTPNYTIVFKGRVKVNAAVSIRSELQDFFGKKLGRKVESHKNYDRVHFDGDGFVAFVYHEDESLVLNKEAFIKAMQVGLLVPSEHYDEVRKIIKESGVAPMLPDDERYKDHSKYYYFHAPGNQVFRIVNAPKIEAKDHQESSFDEQKAALYGADEYGMKKYVFAFLERGPNKSLSKKAVSELQKDHLKNIDRMASEGKLVLAGPFFGNEDLRGIYIFNVATVEEAELLTNTDPAIKAGSLRMNLMEWYGSAALMEVNAVHKSIEKKSVAD